MSDKPANGPDLVTMEDLVAVRLYHGYSAIYGDESDRAFHKRVYDFLCYLFEEGLLAGEVEGHRRHEIATTTAPECANDMEINGK